MRILYVDDDRINTLLFVEACRVTGGIDVETADTGAEATKVAARWRPDLLVIDLNLPDTSGYQLLPLLRAQLLAPQMPAYLCTAEIPQLVEEPARQAGFTGCWSKPMDLLAVLRTLALQPR